MSVYIKNYEAPEIKREEILRYAGVRGDVPEINQLVEECIKEIEKKLTFRVCYSLFAIEISENEIDLGFTRVKSESLLKNLTGSSHIILFAATVGIEVDRLIAKYSITSPAKALIFQAIGAERIESLCELFNREVKEKYKCTKKRFSAGYGDLPLQIQRDIFITLDCPKKIGVTLNDSFLMSPTKSVTAIIGISDEDTKCV